MNEKSTYIISVGLFNFLQGMLHMVQFIQSKLLGAYSTDMHNVGNEDWVDNSFTQSLFCFFLDSNWYYDFCYSNKNYKG
jgi:hypothetical protein